MSDENTKPYRPSNGSEGEGFMARFCDRCVHDRPARARDYVNGCQILARSLAFSITDADYPVEWRQNIGAKWDPFCTAFIEDKGDDHDPPAPDPDPRQLVLIVDPTEDLAAFPVEAPEPVEVFA